MSSLFLATLSRYPCNHFRNSPNIFENILVCVSLNVVSPPLATLMTLSTFAICYFSHIYDCTLCQYQIIDVLLDWSTTAEIRRFGALRQISVLLHLSCATHLTQVDPQKNFLHSFFLTSSRHFWVPFPRSWQHLPPHLLHLEMLLTLQRHFFFSPFRVTVKLMRFNSL